MTTKPQLKLGSHLVPGIAAIALFVVMAAVFIGASFPNPQGFAQDANITASIGYTMFNLGFGDVEGESMLIAFEIIDLVLVGALVGAVLLARREDEGGQMRTILTDGGRELKRTLFDNDEEGDH
ncbi:NADH-quinone oxidoreductase subunit J [Haloferax sp. DFSO60]|uniref:NADH-quinone oxidoreductase subunit J family protein n=1 Tax=Haloferax sp. DFSO60 TaxID=3388652 RepID=UPI0039784F85